MRKKKYEDTERSRVPEGFDRKSFAIQWGVFFAAFLVTVIGGILGLGGMSFGSIKLGKFMLDFQCILFMLFGGLFGYVASMTAVLCVFIYGVIAEPQNAFLVSMCLVSAALFSIAGQNRVFAGKTKTLIFCIISTFSMAAMSTLVFTIRSYDLNPGDSVITEYGVRIVSQILQCTLATYACRLFFKYSPDHVKRRVALGLLYYDRDYETNEEKRRALRKNALSKKVTTLILGEAVVIVISAIAFTRTLFPDLQRMSAVGREDPGGRNNVTEQVTGEDEGTEGKEAQNTLESILEGNYIGFLNDKEVQDAYFDKVDRMLPEVGEAKFVFNTYSYAYVLKMILMLLCVSVPVAMLMNFYAQVGIAGPISLISDHMVRFSSTPREKLRKSVENIDKLDIRTRDEIEQLYHAVDQTVHDVTDMIDKIQEEAKLEEDLRVAEMANEAKSVFLSNMSHEIRTPINAVLGMDEMILRESEDPVALRYAVDIRNAGRTLLSLVNDILDFSKIEAGKMEIMPVQYEVASTINDLVNMIRDRARDKGLELIVHVDENIPHLLLGDEIRIKQCVTNILTNAVKYTEKGSVTMTVGFEKENDKEIRMKFSVKDTGIGIKEEDLNRLYSPFERIEEIRNRTIEGTGLGMSIVKKLLAMMDTKLVVESVYGEGSDFSFDVLQEVIDWAAVGNLEESYKRAEESIGKYRESFHAPEAKLLIVDDTKMNLTVIRGLLKQTQVRITTAESGREMLQLVQEEKYDVILLDHRMPEMDGVETLAAMKELSGNLNSDTPVLALTANAVSGAREFYIDAGFQDYLTKPIDPGKLEKSLISFIPKEKLILPTDPRFSSEDEAADGDEGEKEAEELLLKAEGIDLSAAVENCGSKEVLIDAIRDFLIALPSKSDQIEQYAATGDYRNYTVHVHALKSSARLIGAMQLSSDAAYLEQCGNEENKEEIEKKTPELLELYRSYKKKLSALSPETDNADPDKQEIPEDDLLEAWMGMKEFIEAYDFDSADKIMKMLEDYNIPSNYKEKYDKIKELMAAVDRDALLELI